MNVMQQCYATWMLHIPVLGIKYDANIMLCSTQGNSVLLILCGKSGYWTSKREL